VPGLHTERVCCGCCVGWKQHRCPKKQEGDAYLGCLSRVPPAIEEPSTQQPKALVGPAWSWSVVWMSPLDAFTCTACHSGSKYTAPQGPWSVQLGRIVDHGTCITSHLGHGAFDDLSGLNWMPPSSSVCFTAVEPLTLTLCNDSPTANWAYWL
jgi:hypothetical protein